MPNRSVTIDVTADDIARNRFTAIESAIQCATQATRVRIGVWTVFVEGRRAAYLPSRVASIDADLSRGEVVAPFSFELKLREARRC